MKRRKCFASDRDNSEKGKMHRHAAKEGGLSFGLLFSNGHHQKCAKNGNGEPSSQAPAEQCNQLAENSSSF
jgi:hypothetical protein